MSPVPEQWNHEELLQRRAPNQTEGSGNVGPDEDAIEEFKDIYKKLSEQVRTISRVIQLEISHIYSLFRVSSDQTNRKFAVSSYLTQERENAVTREHAQSVQELEATKAKLNESRAEITALRGQVERTEAALNSTRQQLLKTGEHANVKMAESSELVERLEQVVREAEEFGAEHEKEVAKGKDITMRVAEANKKIQELVLASVFPLLSTLSFSDVCGAFSSGSMEKKLQELEVSRNSYNRLVGKNAEDVNGLNN